MTEAQKRQEIQDLRDVAADAEKEREPELQARAEAALAKLLDDSSAGASTATDPVGALAQKRKNDPRGLGERALEGAEGVIDSIPGLSSFAGEGRRIGNLMADAFGGTPGRASSRGRPGTLDANPTFTPAERDDMNRTEKAVERAANSYTMGGSTAVMRLLDPSGGAKARREELDRDPAVQKPGFLGMSPATAGTIGGMIPGIMAGPAKLIDAGVRKVAGVLAPRVLPSAARVVMPAAQRAMATLDAGKMLTGAASGVAQNAIQNTLETGDASRAFEGALPAAGLGVIGPAVAGGASETSRYIHGPVDDPSRIGRYRNAVAEGRYQHPDPSPPPTKGILGLEKPGSTEFFNPQPREVARVAPESPMAMRDARDASEAATTTMFNRNAERATQSRMVGELELEPHLGDRSSRQNIIDVIREQMAANVDPQLGVRDPSLKGRLDKILSQVESTKPLRPAPVIEGVRPMAQEGLPIPATEPLPQPTPPMEIPAQLGQSSMFFSEHPVPEKAVSGVVSVPNARAGVRSFANREWTEPVDMRDMPRTDWLSEQTGPWWKNQRPAAPPVAAPEPGKRMRPPPLGEGSEDYLYHVAPEDRLSSIKEHGLVPGKPKANGDLLDKHGADRVFLTENGGLETWDYLKGRGGVIVRVKRNALSKLEVDTGGTKDGGAPAWSVGGVPSEHLERWDGRAWHSLSEPKPPGQQLEISAPPAPPPIPGTPASGGVGPHQQGLGLPDPPLKTISLQEAMGDPTIGGLRQMRAQARQRAGFENPSPTPEQLDARAEYKVWDGAIKRSASPQYLEIEQGMADSAKGMRRERDLFSKTEANLIRGGADDASEHVRDVPENLDDIVKSNAPDVRVGKRQGVATFMGRVGDENVPGKTARSAHEELRASDPVYAEAQQFVDDVKMHEGTRFGPDAVLPADLHGAVAAGGLKEAGVQNIRAAVARLLEPALGATMRQAPKSARLSAGLNLDILDAIMSRRQRTDGERAR